MESNSPWLAVLAIAAAVQTLTLLGIIVGGLVAYRRVTTTIERLERESLAPLLQRAHRAFDGVDSLVGRVESADDEVRAALSRTGDRVTKTARTMVKTALSVRAGLWPVLGAGQAALAAMSAFTDRHGSRRERKTGPRPVRRAAPDDDLSRFVYEGGTDNARS